jgi:hypothetical protein
VTRCGVTIWLKVPLIKLSQHTHPPFYRFVMHPLKGRVKSFCITSDIEGLVI